MDDLRALPIVFDDHGSWVTSVMFTKDDKYLISGDKDGNIRSFPTDVNSLIVGFCNFLSRELTQSEWQNYVGTDIPYKPTKCNNR
jgi:WD40 repeat protein